MSLATRKALYGKMAGDSTLNGLLGDAGVGILEVDLLPAVPLKERFGGREHFFPYVIFQQQAETPTWTFKQGQAAMVDEVWMIKGVDRSGSADGADNIADRLVALLTDGVLTISGKTQLYLRWDSGLPSYSETVDGQRYIHAGALFRLVYE